MASKKQLVCLFLVSLAIQQIGCKISSQKYVDDPDEDESFSYNNYGYKRAIDSTQTMKGIESIDSYHPLDPLTAFEMRLAAVIIQLHNNTGFWRFKYVGLREPNKTVMYPYFLSQTAPPAGLISRRANALITDPGRGRPIWVVVNLSSFQVESWTEAEPGENVAAITVEDNELASQIALADPAVVARIKQLGYNDLSKIIPDIWESGYVADNPNYSQYRKLVQIFFYGINGSGTNYYAHPLDFVVYVELGANKVRGIENLPIQQGFDTKDRRGNSVPSAEENYFPELRPPSSIRRDLHRIQISQSEGPSFRISGREVSWQNFKLRLGYNPREGPHLYTVTYNDNGEIRPILYRMSLSEVYLQYGDPRPPYHKKSLFDEGNGEFGSSLVVLPVHQFCRGNAFYYEAHHHNDKVETWILQNSICVVEEDSGVLWAHHDCVSDRTAVTRSQRLSISYVVAIGNTDYFISWRFYQDATIELAIKVTGILSTNLMAVDVKAPPYGTLVAPQVYSQIYQHFFAVRVDADVDGLDNTVSIEDIAPVSGSINSANPYGNGITVNNTVLKTAGEAPSDYSLLRSWKISNPNNVHSLSGQPVSWKLMPGSYANLLTPDSPIRGRVSWADHSMWVLPYDSDQILGGKYLDDGVSAWTKLNASANIENEDVVLWHIFSYVHKPDIEDWPVLSEGITGFRLKPSGFFNENPAISVPPASETTVLDENPTSSSGWSSTMAS